MFYSSEFVLQSISLISGVVILSANLYLYLAFCSYLHTQVNMNFKTLYSLDRQLSYVCIQCHFPTPVNISLFFCFEISLRSQFRRKTNKSCKKLIDRQSESVRKSTLLAPLWIYFVCQLCNGKMVVGLFPYFIKLYVSEQLRTFNFDQ